MNNDLISEKKRIRKMIKLETKELLKDKENKRRYDIELIEKLLLTDLYKNSNNIFCYVGMNDEIDTSIFIKRALKEGKNISVPRVTGKITMDAVIINSIEDLQVVPPYGILEPLVSDKIMDKIDLIIVPGVAFNKDGGRVGHGAGYYDYFMKRHKEARTVALCYDFQLIDNIPEEEHDMRIEKIIVIEN